MKFLLPVTILNQIMIEKCEKKCFQYFSTQLTTSKIKSILIEI